MDSSPESRKEMAKKSWNIDWDKTLKQMEFVGKKITLSIPLNSCLFCSSFLSYSCTSKEMRLTTWLVLNVIRALKNFWGSTPQIFVVKVILIFFFSNLYSLAIFQDMPGICHFCISVVNFQVSALQQDKLNLFKLKFTKFHFTLIHGTKLISGGMSLSKSQTIVPEISPNESPWAR